MQKGCTLEAGTGDEYGERSGSRMMVGVEGGEIKIGRKPVFLCISVSHAQFIHF
jgi:hypothetical protein